MRADRLSGLDEVVDYGQKQRVLPPAQSAMLIPGTVAHNVSKPLPHHDCVPLVRFLSSIRTKILKQRSAWPKANLMAGRPALG